jgi:hypothetical protein
MRTYEQQLNYERLELIPAAQAASLKTKIASAVKTAWRNLIRIFAPGSEPCIYQTSDASGQWWYVYDPITGDSAWLTSETEVLIWLDSRYYKRGRLLND